MWVVLVHCVVSLIAASMGNTLPGFTGNCITDSNNLVVGWTYMSMWPWGKEGLQCTSPHPEAKMRQCIPLDWVCDGNVLDGCGNGEDEGEICGGYGEQDRTCTNPLTGKAYGWRCRSGNQRCILNSKLCDGQQNCEDGSDEGEVCGGYGEQDRACINPVTGEAVGWRCRSGSPTTRHIHYYNLLWDSQSCIPNSFLCNGDHNCEDGSDEGEVCGGYGEQNRTCTNPVTGEAVAWRCKSGLQRCVSSMYLCDGSEVCVDEDNQGEICGGYGEQDRTCTNPITGEATGWRCRSGSQRCIARSRLCDGGQDCEDGSDEDEMCGGYGEQDRTCTNPLTGEAVGLRCRSGSQLCVRYSKFCDGRQDCEDGDDEGEMCGGYGEQDRICTNPTMGKVVGWRCRTGSQLCIPGWMLCSRNLYASEYACDDGEDQLRCRFVASNPALIQDFNMPYIIHA